MALYYKSGDWKKANMYFNFSSSWREVYNIYIHTSGAWKPIWSYRYDVGGWGSCSVSCGGGYQYRSVSCVRSDGVNKSDSMCSKAGISRPASSRQCNTQSCVTQVYISTGIDSQGILYWYHPVTGAQQQICGVAQSCGGTIYVPGVDAYPWIRVGANCWNPGHPTISWDVTVTVYGPDGVRSGHHFYSRYRCTGMLYAAFNYKTNELRPLSGNCNDNITWPV